MLKEIPADCLLFRMGAVPFLPRRILTVQCSGDVVNEYFRLWRENPAPALCADTLILNPHLICEDTMTLFSGVRKYRGAELPEKAGVVFPGMISPGFMMILLFCMPDTALAGRTRKRDNRRA